MARKLILVPALALAAALATGGPAAAQDTSPAKDAAGGTTMTLGGKGSAARAAAADDTELTWCHRRCYGCGWGCGYRCGWGGGYYGGYGVSYYSYAPAFPAYSYSSFSYAPYSCYRPYYGGFGGGFYVGINGKESDASAPAVSLNRAVADSPAVASRAANPAGAFRYDGGPANPVPLPKADAAPSTPAAPAATGLPVSLKAKPARPYTYKAYGEK
jgi:hypothetical protein